MHRRLAFPTPRVVLARSNRVLDHRVADDEARAWWKRNRRKAERSAVQEEGLSGAAVQRDELVHDAAGGADALVLSPLAQPRDRLAVETYPSEASERQRHRYFGARRGAEPGPNGTCSRSAGRARKRHPVP